MAGDIQMQLILTSGEMAAHRIKQKSSPTQQKTKSKYSVSVVYGMIHWEFCTKKTTIVLFILYPKDRLYNFQTKHYVLN